MQPSHGCVDVLQRIDHLGAELAELPSGDDEHIGAAQEGTEDSCHGFGDTGLGRGQGVVEIEGDIATMQLTRTTQEARIGDRLFPGEERAVNSTFMPSAPSTQVEGVILDVPRGVTQIGQFDVVTLNKGARDGLQDGNVLAVYKTGETVRDRVTGENVKIPDERSGLLMVFRTYDKLSYGLVLQATRSLSVKDKVRNP